MINVVFASFLRGIFLRVWLSENEQLHQQLKQTIAVEVITSCQPGVQFIAAPLHGGAVKFDRGRSKFCVSFTYDGLQRQVMQSITDGRGNATTTRYLAYGEPAYQQPLTITSPENVTATLAVNLFGYVTAITQVGKSVIFL
ncbi:hypothetical protein [Thalassomonas actiniarum]|uniref:Uncharacterized protein n=1 Tax=Thalassomonas actiniarum TaxID=485447 RepID=A0AAF0C283_9GAMM|nr:hypothetical protein [Thalassomonas actiniarum]WDD98212.1 hypothetical protein SG35_023515 [Thalassomonas actiniarum]